MSDKRGSNPQHLPWEGSTLPLSYYRKNKQFQPYSKLGIIIYTASNIAPSILCNTAIMLNENLPSRIKFHIIVFYHLLNNYTSQIFNILCYQDSIK